MQVVLDFFYNGKNDTKEKLVAVLRKSYEQLDTHARRMFLDAALLVRGRPEAHLTALWEGQLLLNEPPSDQLPRRRRLSLVDWQRSTRVAAADVAGKLLRELKDLSLVNKQDGSR